MVRAVLCGGLWGQAQSAVRHEPPSACTCPFILEPIPSLFLSEPSLALLALSSGRRPSSPVAWFPFIVLECLWPAYNKALLFQGPCSWAKLAPVPHFTVTTGQRAEGGSGVSWDCHTWALPVGSCSLEAEQSLGEGPVGTGKLAL